MKWFIVFILVLLVLGLLLFPEQTKTVVGFAIVSGKTLTGYAIKYGPIIINKTVSLMK